MTDIFPALHYGFFPLSVLLRSYSENRNKKFQIQGGGRISPAPPASAPDWRHILLQEKIRFLRKHFVSELRILCLEIPLKNYFFQKHICIPYVDKMFWIKKV